MISNLEIELDIKMKDSVPKIGRKFFAVLNIVTVLVGEQSIVLRVWNRKLEFQVISFASSVYLSTGWIAASICTTIRQQTSAFSSQYRSVYMDFRSKVSRR